MDIIFKSEKQVNGKTKVNAWLPYEDNHGYCGISLRSFIKILKSMLPDEKKDVIDFFSLRAGSYKFYESDTTTFEILVREVNGVPVEIMRTANKYDTYNNLSDLKSTLNTEIKRYGNNKENIHYEIYQVKGKLDLPS